MKPLLGDPLSLFKLPDQMGVALTKCSLGEAEREARAKGLAMVREDGSREKPDAKVLHGDSLQGLHDKLSSPLTLLLLAKQIGQGGKRVHQIGVVRVPPEVVRAQGDEEPLPVVELVLPVDVEAELVGDLGQLSNPLDLLRSCEALTTHLEVLRLQGAQQHAPRCHQPRRARRRERPRRRHGDEVGQCGGHQEWNAELFELKDILDLIAPRLHLLPDNHLLGLPERRDPCSTSQCTDP